MDRALCFWQRLQNFLDIKGDVVLLFFTGAVIYRIIHGPALGAADAACYATCVTAFAATKIKQSP